jgi:hemoglobin-like flavoprotein
MKRVVTAFAFAVAAAAVAAPALSGTSSTVRQPAKTHVQLHVQEHHCPLAGTGGTSADL